MVNIFSANLMNMINERDMHPIHSIFAITINKRESEFQPKSFWNEDGK